jgi:hypothetical protein
MKVCETCRYAQQIPKELEEQFKDILKWYPKKYYCSLLNEVKVYDPNNPSACFNCDKHEVKQ